MAYSTYVPADELERPQRTALQRALEAMTPPGLVQQGTMLRERFDALGPVRVAERTADDLTGLFGRLGPISPLEALNPAALGARAGAAAGRAAAESEAGVEAELRAGETLREFGESESGQYLQAPLAPARSTFGAMGEAYQRGQEAAPGLLGAGLGALGAVPAGFRQLGEQAALGAGFTPEQAAAQGRLAGIVSPGLGGLEQGGRRLGQIATAGLGGIGAAKGALETPGGAQERLGGAVEGGLNWAQFGQPVGAVGDVLRGGINRLGRRVGRAARAEYGEGLGAAAGTMRPAQGAAAIAGSIPETGLGVFVPGRGLIAGQATDRVHADVARRVAEETGQELPPTAVRLAWNAGNPFGPSVMVAPLGQMSLTQERAALRAAVDAAQKVTPPDWRFQVMTNDLTQYEGVVGDGVAGLRRLGTRGGEAGEDVLGIRRGQRLRQPPLTPEQQVQRAADGAAEQRVFDAIRALWRRGPAGEEIADELRFLSVGKGEAGEAAARELLASRGLEDVLPPPTAAGVLPGSPGSTTAGEGVLGLARRATEPLMARGAVTPGERAFDVAAGTAGGVVGAATAEEDATWQERVGRGALGASLGALGGANLRQLGRVARGALGDEALGVVPRSAQTHPEAYPSATGVERQGALPGFREPPQIGPLYRPPGATYPGTRAPAPRPPESVTAPPGAVEEAVPRSGWGVAADIGTSAPLLRPSSLLTNLLGGAVRTFQRWGEESAGAAWVDHTLKESVADLLGMASEVPGAVRDLRRVFRQGGTSAVRGQLGAQSGSLVTDPGLGAQVLTAGTRLNLAPDAAWGRINAAGAKARAAARGITDPDDVSLLSERASDFATFVGKASKATEFLGGFRKTLTDPDASGAQKAWALGMVGITPYLRMPERFMAATGRVLLDPAMLGYSRFSKNGLVRQAVEGNQDAKREVAGRLTMSGLAYTLGLGAFAAGQLYGAPPKDAKQRRLMEAAGVRWNTIMGVDTKKLGNFGQAMSALGTALTAAQRTYEQGADGADVMRAFVGESWRWALEESFLRGLSDFDVAIRQGRGMEHAEKVAADVATRPLSGIAGYVDPWDPYERERRGTANELLEGLPGGRYAMPTRIDPATGEAVRREGSGLERMFFGSRGRVESPEARELAIRGVTAREFQPADTVYGHVQTPQARRALQETFGRYTRDYVRDTMARPDYQSATPEEQAATLRRQVGLAQQLADIEVGDKVARDAGARFELEWLRTPHYRGVEGPPERVARQNLEIREAKQLLDEYQRRFGETPGRHRFYDEHPDLIDLARRPGVPERALAEEKEAVRQRTGASETRDAALVGAGNTVLPAPTPAFTAP